MLCACLLSQPAHAQMGGGGYWTVQSDSGNPLTPNNDGSYRLTGPMTGSAQNTYPGLLGLAQSQPSDSQSQYVNAYYPNELSSPFNFLYNAAPNNVGYAPYSGSLQLNASAANADIFSYGYNHDIGAFWMPRGTPLDGAPFCPDVIPPSTLSVNGSVSANATGTLTAVWKWVPYSMMGMGGTPAPPPPYLDLLVSAPVSAGVNPNYGNASPSGGLTGTAMADNGLGDALNVTESSVPSSQSLPGKHLLHLPVNLTTGQVTVTVSGQVITIANNGVSYGQLNSCGPNAFYFGRTNGYTSVSSNANVGATARQDSREVSISCPAIEDSYYKGAYDSQHGTDRYLHQRNLDGGIVTDSAVCWTNSFGGTWITDGNGASTGVSFTANAANFVQPTYAWSLLGDGTPDSQTQSYLSSNVATVPIRLSFGMPTTAVLNKATTVQVNVQDTDSATAINTFGVNWHLPFEATDFIGQTGIGKSVDQTLISDIGPSGDYDLQASKSEDLDLSAVFDAGEVISAVAGQEEVAGAFKIAAALAKVSDSKIHYEGKDIRKGNRNDGSSWGVAQLCGNDIYGGGNISPASEASDSNGWMLCKFSLCVVSKWHENSWHADKYTIHGYDSPGHVITVHITDMIDEEPYFVQYKNSNGTPYTG